MDAEDSFIIPPSLFDEKPFIVIDILFCEEKENKYKDFITKFNHPTNGKCCISVNWITKKVKRLFQLKDKNIYPECKIYHGLCSPKENYIGESKRNVVTRLREDNNSIHNSEPAKLTNKNIQHSLNWAILANSSNQIRPRKNFEVIYIALFGPYLGLFKGLKPNKLLIFRNGII